MAIEREMRVRLCRQRTGPVSLRGWSPLSQWRRNECVSLPSPPGNIHQIRQSHRKGVGQAYGQTSAEDFDEKAPAERGGRRKNVTVDFCEGAGKMKLRSVQNSANNIKAHSHERSAKASQENDSRLFFQREYLNVTIICEYKILRFWGSNDFAGINFCDFTKSS